PHLRLDARRAVRPAAPGVRPRRQPPRRPAAGRRPLRRRPAARAGQQHARRGGGAALDRVPRGGGPAAGRAAGGLRPAVVSGVDAGRGRRALGPRGADGEVALAEGPPAGAAGAGRLPLRQRRPARVDGGQPGAAPRYGGAEMTPMQPDDETAEWLARGEEAVAANRPPPALDQLPTELHPRAREGLRLLRGVARMAHRLTATAPGPPGA